MVRMVAVFYLALAVGTVALAQGKKNIKDEVQQSEAENARIIFRTSADISSKDLSPPAYGGENRWKNAVFRGVKDGNRVCDCLPARRD
jgi:hypothetical protein